MTLYLTDRTPPAEIHAARASGFVVGAKLYPAGATTHSDAGVTSIDTVWRALEAMAEHGPRAAGARRGDRPAESTCSTASTTSSTACSRGSSSACPGSRSCSSTSRRATAVEFVRAARPGVAATITPQHLLHEPQCDVRRRHPPAPLLPAGAEARARPRGAAWRPPRATTRASSSAPTARRTRATRRRQPAAAPASSRRTRASSCTRRCSRRPAGSTASRPSRRSAAPISTGCRATRARSPCGASPVDGAASSYPFGGDELVPLRAGGASAGALVAQ